MNYLYWSGGFLLGNCILQQLPRLPSYPAIIGLLLFGCLLFFLNSFLNPFLNKSLNLKWKPKHFSAGIAGLCLGFLWGFLWTWGWSSYYLNQQLPAELIKQNVEVVGQVASIPQRSAQHVSFNFRVQEVTFNQQSYSAPKFIRLSWYKNGYSKIPVTIPDLKVGQTWRFVVRMKPPYSFSSPGALDFSQHLFAKRIGATGYVYTQYPTELLSTEVGIQDYINHIRERVWRDLLDVFQGGAQTGMVSAFVLGETSNITPEEWRILQMTGTTHLIAVSGLNIGLIAVMVLMMVHFVWRHIPALTERYPPKIVGSFVGLVAGFIYTALAGFAIPTQRALIALAVVMLGIIQLRSSAHIYVFATAVTLILLYDPLATLSMSFWLSYLAVAAIFYLMAGRTFRTNDLTTKCYQWMYFQFAISLLLAPLTLWFFQQAPLISPLANAVATPWVSFVVVPLSLLGSLFLYIWKSLGIEILRLATYAMQGVWHVLVWMSEWPYANWEYSINKTWIFISVIIGVLLLLLPRGISGRWYGLIGLFPLCLTANPQPEYGEVWLDVLDVGQGLSTVVRTQNHILIYDTGDDFSERLNAGSAIVLPFLRKQGANKIDALILSHDNKDHTGGTPAILERVPVDTIYVGEKLKFIKSKTLPCEAGQQWEWDGVLFMMLHPEPEDKLEHKWDDNDASCVIRISAGLHSVLLTGDIESAAEKSLLKKRPGQLTSNIIIAPHHGSRSSSTVKFIQQVNPQYVIFPAGYLNRFNFPNEKIVARYEQQGVTQFTTATLGTIHVEFNANSMSIPTGYRQEYQRYWH
jgi:competence protein ComEC